MTVTIYSFYDVILALIPGMHGLNITYVVPFATNDKQFISSDQSS